jgi:hypothetical protein
MFGVVCRHQLARLLTIPSLQDWRAALKTASSVHSLQLPMFASAHLSLVADATGEVNSPSAFIDSHLFGATIAILKQVHAKKPEILVDLIQHITFATCGVTSDVS